MSIIKCFTEHGRADLQSKFEEAVKGGKNEFEAARDILYDEHKSLHDKTNKLRTELKIPTQEYAIPERKTTPVPMDETSRNSETVGGGVPHPKESTNAQEETISQGEGESTGIAHAATEEVRKKYKLGDYERSNATDAELNDAAEEAIKKGYNPETLVGQMEKGVPPTGTENFILKKYLATLQAKFEKDPSDANLDKIQRLVKATDKIGSLQSEAFRTRKGLEPVEDSRADFFITELAANNDAPLTEGQKKTANKEYEDLSEARKKLDEDQKALDEKVAAFRAEQEVAKTKKDTKPKAEKRTHDDFVKERKSLKEELSAAKEKHLQWLKDQGIQQQGASPFVLTVDMAKVIGKIIKSHIEEGAQTLADVTKKVYEEIKDLLPDISEKDIHDVIAGEYNEKKGTKKEAAIVAENLRIEAQLINKLDRLENGTEPKNEKAKVQRNQEIHQLRNRIADFRRENPDYEGKLKQLTERNKKETERIKDKIENGEFEPEAKATPLLEQKQLQKQFPKEFLKAQRSNDALIKVRNEIAIRRATQMYENKSGTEKTMEIFAKTLNVPRTLMASFDFSAPLRQGIVASVAHPVMASKALRFMFESAKDEKVYNRWLDMVHKSDRWDWASKTDLGITDPQSLHIKEHEEAFQGAPYAEKIPIIGLGVKASERAYVGYLNHLRWNLFNMYADRFEAMGKTYENNPELYKGISSFINSSTGRGNLEGKMKNAAPLLNSFLFASKLMASRLNMLGLSDIPNLAVRAATLGKRGIDYGFYTKLPKELRVEAMKDMLKFVGVGATILLTAKMMGANVEDDPRSSDFGKIHVGNTRWDIWGGFQPYARVLTQFITGERKATTTGKIQELNGKGFMGQTRATPLWSFMRTKLAPIPGTAVNLISGSDVVGNKVTPLGELTKMVIPLLGQDIYQGMQDQGVKAIFTVGIPSAFGVGVQTFQPNVGGKGGSMGGGGAKGSFKQKSMKPTK